jgi:hypothetical protein
MKTTRDKFVEEYKKIQSVQQQGTPFRRGKYFFYFKKNFDERHHVLWRDDFDESKSEVLNPNTLLGHKVNVYVFNIAVSNDGQVVAYTLHEISPEGQSAYVTVFRNLDRMLDIPHRLVSSIPPSLVWGMKGVYYTCKESENDSVERIYYHELERAQDQDVMLDNVESAPNYTLTLMGSASLDDLVVQIQDITGSTNNKVHVISGCLNFENGEGRLSYTRLVDNFLDGEFELVASSGQSFWFRTNHHAPNFRIIKIDTSPIVEDISGQGFIPLHEVSHFTITEEESRGGFDDMKARSPATGERESLARLNLEHNFLEICGAPDDLSISNPKSSTQASAHVENRGSSKMQKVFVITECIAEDDYAFLESAAVVAENLLLMKYSRNSCHELLVVEFKTRDQNNLEVLPRHNVSNPVPVKITLPGKGSVIGPSCQHLSSDFFYKYVSFDEPGIVFWGLVGRANDGTVEVSSQVVFKSSMSDATSEFQPQFETKILFVPTEEADQNIPVFLFGRSFTPEDKVHTWSKLATQTHVCQKDDEAPVKTPSPPIRPRSCMIVLNGHTASLPLISFSPSHFIFAKHFNGIVCSIRLPRSNNVKEIVSHILLVAEYLIDGSYTTSDQLGYLYLIYLLFFNFERLYLLFKYILVFMESDKGPH